jgi:DNA-binding MarR family transcriptional regulator
MTLTSRQYLQINQALFSLAHAYDVRMAAERERDTMGLRLSDCSVLMVLHQLSPLTARRLSQAMDINPGTISVYVQRLVEKGLVEKRQDARDRRHWWITLTPTGRAAAEGVVAGAVEYTRDFLSPLSESEQNSLHRLLRKASHGLGFDWQ